MCGSKDTNGTLVGVILKESTAICFLTQWKGLQ